MDVAVKVIEHDGSSYAAVEEEMDVMMSFNHPNIVRCAWQSSCIIVAVLTGSHAANMGLVLGMRMRHTVHVGQSEGL
jgi:hypothetical protein